jgi:glutamate 5-kinase
VQVDAVREATVVMGGGAQAVFGDIAEVVALLQALDAVLDRRGIPEILLDDLSGRAELPLVPDLREDDVPGEQVVPIINENDTVVTDEIKFGDNDTLGALVANLIEADALVILTDQRGLYSADPRKDPEARLIGEAQAGDPALEAMAGGAGSSIGRGGMLTKVLAARRAARSGAHTVIAWGREEEVLTRLARGEAIGTQLTAATGRLTARRQWMVDHLHTTGEVVIDQGAAQKLTREGKSLLPIGVLAVNGEFGRGQVITCVDEQGRALARGLTNYASSEVRRIMRRSSGEIEGILGFVEGSELVHRDNMVLLETK